MTDQLPVAFSKEPKGAALDLLHIVRINEESKAVVAVAFKINIMALNAIFLAKRAGTAALGFGVLSNELRSFSSQLRETMLSLNGLIHSSVEEVSVVLQDSRYTAVLKSAVVLSPSEVHLQAVIERREQRSEKYRGKLSALRRALRSSVDDAYRLVELGGVLAKSAKIEAAYGAGFSASLAQVSGEFDGIVEEIRGSLDILRKSSFFRG
jgi:methyl-accepting chemotaxis protein